MRTYILLGISILAGLAAFVIFRNQVNAEKRRLGLLGEKQKVVVAKKDMLRDEVIDDPERQLDRKPMFAKNLTRNRDGGYSQVIMNQENLNEILGKRLALSVDKGQPLRWADFQDSARRRKDGFAYLVDKEHNHRALSIAVDNTSSVSNLIGPNDHIDIIGTFRFPQLRSQADVETMTLTLLQNVNVLAVGKRYHQGRIRSSNRDRGYTTITLSVTAKEAEMLVFAQQKGQLTFTLRHPEDVYTEKDVQDVDFKYLKANLKVYMKERSENLEMKSKTK